MNSPQAIQLDPTLANFLSSYWQWRKLWIFTTVCFCFLGFAYAVFLKKDTWVASQALIVRDEATGAVMRLGRFESQTQMKASQETVLEMARNPVVVEAALKAVGSQPKLFGLVQSDSEPTRAEIEEFAKSSVVVRAPRGAELGTTEVIYLDVKDSSKERAVQLTNALCDALEKQLKAMRVELAVGVIQELEAARAVCEASLQEATNELQKMEIEMGSDLADLRGLSDTAVGSTNRLMLDMVRDELRKADLKIRTMEPNFKLAQAALQDPSLVLQAADALKDSHPAIHRLREGLADARVKTATLEGRFTANHADVVNARKIEAAFRQSMVEELEVVVRGYQSSIAISQQKIEALNAQEIELGKRLNRLADIRGRYTNLLAEVKNRADSLSQVKKELTQTIASRDAAEVASLLTRLDTPVLGEKPVGPGRSTIVGGATVGGLMFGLGVVFLLIPLDACGATSAKGQRDPLDRLERLTSNIVPQTADEEEIALKESRLNHLAAAQKLHTAPPSYRPSSGDEVDGRLAAMLRQAPPQTATNNSSPNTAPEKRSTTKSDASPVGNSATSIGATTATKAHSSVPAAPVPAAPVPAAPVPAAPVPAAPVAAAAGPTAAGSKTPRRPDSIDDVRDLIANALKSHSQSVNS